MSLFDERAVRKIIKVSQLNAPSTISNEPRQLHLRSRKLDFFQEQSSESLHNPDPQQKPAAHIPSLENLSNFSQSPQKHKSKPIEPKVPETTAKKPQDENIPHQSNFQDEEIESEDEEKNPETLTLRKKRFCKPPTLKKIIHCEYYKDVTEVDFITYFGILAKKKMFSTLLINEFGQVIFADRLGSEHFEGSLNNFARNPIYSTILEEYHQDFFDKVSWIDPKKRNTLKLVIYSKNSKRRYSKKGQQEEMTSDIIFNRYLRCVSCEIKPIRIKFSCTDQFDGYWNKSLMEEGKPLCCYLLISRLSKELPNLKKFDLQSDKKIQKFLRYTQKKQEQRDVRRPKSSLMMGESESESQNDEIKKNEYEDIYSQKELENIMIEMTDHTKYSKSALTRGCVLNSGQGKYFGDMDQM